MNFPALLGLLVFPALMAFAASSDLLTMTIPNRLVLLLAGLFFPMALWAGLPLATIGLHVLVGCAVLTATFAMFTFGWIGGGDAKFAAATVLWLGLDLTFGYLLYSALLGGALTLALLAARRFALPLSLMRHEWICRLHDRVTGIPYGIALAIAGLIIYPETRIFLALIG